MAQAGLAKAVQATSDESVVLAFVDQGYARACSEPIISLSACRRMRQTKATMCKPANVLV